jgi:hypothetical protein
MRYCYLGFCSASKWQLGIWSDILVSLGKMLYSFLGYPSTAVQVDSCVEIRRSRGAWWFGWIIIP